MEDYLAAHEVDFIKFKIDMLLNDCEGDPVKRSKVVASILQSIANIPDEITRSLYVKECSLTFGIDEKVLLRQIKVFIAQLRENAARANARQSSVASIDRQPDSGSADTDRRIEQRQVSPAGETSDADAQTQNGSLPGNDDVESDIPVSAGLTEAVATAEDSHVKVLAPQERALLRLILKFGMMALGEDFGSDEGGAPIKSY